MDASPVTLGAPVRKKSNHPPQGIHSHGRARVPVRTHTRPCSRREQGLVSHGGAEGIRTPDPLDANEVRYRTAPQPRGHTQASRVRRVLRTHRPRRWMSSQGTSGLVRQKILVGPSVACGSAARVHVLVVDLVPALTERYDLGLALGITASFLGLSTSPQRCSTTCSTGGFPEFG